MTLRRPSGTPPPSSARIADAVVALPPLADAICRRYRDEFPDEIERYGEAGYEWCLHDNQWLLSWAVTDVLGGLDLREQVAWLARVLHARGFPLERLVRDLQSAADVVAEGAFGDASDAVAARLAGAAQSVTAPPTEDAPAGPG
jgi:hypothetical protein